MISPHLIILWTLLSHLHVVRFKFKFGALNTCRVYAMEKYLFGIHNPSHTISYHIYIYTWIHETNTIHIYLILFGMIQVISVISQSWNRTQLAANMSYWSVALASVWGTKPSALLAQCFSTSRPVFCGLEKNMFFYMGNHIYTNVV